MRPLLVASVPHTGTMFTYYLLPGKRGQLPGPVFDDHKYVCHITEPHAKEAMEQCYVIVPLRKYSEVEASWQRRGEPIEELERQWDIMLGLNDVHFFNIDGPFRDLSLNYLARRLGVKLETDWRPTNSVRVFGST